MRKETKIGLLVAVCTLIVVYGLKFLGGQNILNASNTFFVEYDDIDMLGKQEPVLINGFSVGVVTDIYLNPENYKKIIVVLEVDKDISISKTAVAEIVSTGFMGDKAINLNFDGICTADCATSGTYLSGRTIGLLQSFVDEESLDLAVAKMKAGVGGIVDTLKSKFSEGEGGETINDLKATLRNLNALTYSLNRTFSKSSNDLENMIEDMAKVMANLRENNVNVTSILSNVEGLTSQLANANIDETLKATSATMTSAKMTMDEFQTTLKNTNALMVDVKGLMTNINNGEGTMGRLMKDDDLYINLERTTKNLELLLQDFRLNPKRYVNVSVFGKKDKAYVVPKEDPASQKLEQSENNN